MGAQTIVRTGFESASTRRTVSDSTIKTILVHIQNAGSAKERVEAALSIARATSAHVTCLHVTPAQAYVAFDGFGGMLVMDSVMKAIDEEAEKLRAEVEAELANEDVSWDYIQLTGDVTSEIACHAALADLVVTAREPVRNEVDVPTISLLGNLLQRSRTPLFIPGTQAVDPTGPALIAWNGSVEAANAARGALGLLKIASDVRVVQVEDERQPYDGFPGTELLEYLSRQGIHAELVAEPLGSPEEEGVAERLLAHARKMGGAYIVMGGYSRNRFSEFLFGGVTRNLLRESSAPLVIAH